MYQGLATGQGVGITTACEDPVAAIKFLDYICSDEGQVLVNWGIEGTNYESDENGHRYRTEEEIKKESEDKNYKKTTGVGFHNYPFPNYGTGVTDSTGSTFSTDSKESIIAEYNEEQQAACKADPLQPLKQTDSLLIRRGPVGNQGIVNVKNQSPVSLPVQLLVGHEIGRLQILSRIKSL